MWFSVEISQLSFIFSLSHRLSLSVSASDQTFSHRESALSALLLFYFTHEFLSYAGPPPGRPVVYCGHPPKFSAPCECEKSNPPFESSVSKTDAEEKSRWFRTRASHTQILQIWGLVLRCNGFQRKTGRPDLGVKTGREVVSGGTVCAVFCLDTLIPLFSTLGG